MQNNIDLSKFSLGKEIKIIDKKKQGEIFTNPDAYATTLLVKFVGQFDLDAVYWKPKTIKMEIENYYNINLPENNFNKLMTAIAILTTDLFYVDLQSFINFCNILSDDFVSFEVLNIADSLECAWGLTESFLIYPPEENFSFNSEIKGYIEHILKEEGYITVPKVFQPIIDAADYVNKISYDEKNLDYIYRINESKIKDIDFMINRNMNELMQQLREVV